jgi:seryl-tRNA synthetase
MADRRQVEARIKKKEQEIQSLEEQIKEAKVYVQALQDVLKMFPRETTGAGDAEAMLRAGSSVAQAREAILKHGRAMHVDEILRAIGKEASRVNKTALGGSISAYVRKREVFTRPAPNTFGLIELQQKGAAAGEPPADFGVEPIPVDEPAPF